MWFMTTNESIFERNTKDNLIIWFPTYMGSMSLKINKPNKVSIENISFKLHKTLNINEVFLE